LRSALSEKDSIELVRQLETFRVVVGIVANINDTDSPIPTEIFAVRKSRDFKSLGIDPNFGGIFRSTLRRNLVFIRELAGAEEVPIIIHEYAHFLLSNRGSINYPGWYNEGLAEYLSAPQNRPGIFVVGGVHKNHAMSMSRLPWIPLRDILAPEDYEDWGRRRTWMFYTESWALVHYLHHRPERATLGQDMARYIELLDSGEDDLSAFEEAFEITAEELDKRVRRYVGERKRGARKLPAYLLSIDEIIPDFEPEVNALSREQISLALGKAALSFGELDSARHWFTIATTNEFTRPQAEAGLGDVLKFDDQYEAAQPHFETAIALAPNDPYCQLDIAEYWHDRARESEDTDERATYLANARNHYVEAWKLNDSMPETYALYGQTFLLEGEKYDKAIEMLEQAESILPASITVRVMLAEAYVGAGRNDDAVKAARSVLAWSHEESDAANQAREILAELALATE
jgi:tetratricopeptide (TPR) repeat protein